MQLSRTAINYFLLKHRKGRYGSGYPSSLMLYLSGLKSLVGPDLTTSLVTGEPLLYDDGTVYVGPSFTEYIKPQDTFITENCTFLNSDITALSSGTLTRVGTTINAYGTVSASVYAGDFTSAVNDRFSFRIVASITEEIMISCDGNTRNAIDSFSITDGGYSSQFIWLYLNENGDSGSHTVTAGDMLEDVYLSVVNGIGYHPLITPLTTQVSTAGTLGGNGYSVEMSLGMMAFFASQDSGTIEFSVLMGVASADITEDQNIFTVTDTVTGGLYRSAGGVLKFAGAEYTVTDGWEAGETLKTQIKKESGMVSIGVDGDFGTAVAFSPFTGITDTLRFGFLTTAQFGRGDMKVYNYDY